MQKIILPVVQPPVKGFSHQAALLSILLGHRECQDWVCNNYIQLFSLKNLVGMRSGTLDFYYMDYNDFRSYEYAANPWLRYFEIPISILDMENLKRLLMRQLEKQFYIHVEIDEYYIHSYDSHEKQHVSHWIYIYGYDQTADTFLCMDNYRDLKFYSDAIPVEELITSIRENYNAFLKRTEFDSRMTAEEKIGPSISMFQVLPYLEDPENKEPLSVNIGRIISLLKNYLQMDSENLPYNNSHYYVYGTEVYQSLHNYLEFILREDWPIDIRAFYSLMDHKALMVWRMEYLCNDRYIKADQISALNDIIADYRNSVLNKMRIQIALLMKYNITGEKKNLHKVLCGLEAVKEKEIQILMRFVALLEQSLFQGVNF